MEGNQFMGIDYERRRSIMEGKESVIAGKKGKVGKLVKNVKVGSEFKGQQSPQVKIKASGKSKESKEIQSSKVEEIIEKTIKYRERYNQLNSQQLHRNMQLPLQSIPEGSKESKRIVKDQALIVNETKLASNQEQAPQILEVLQRKISLKSAQKGKEGKEGKIVRNRLNDDLLKTSNKSKETRLIRSNTQPNQLKMQLSPVKDRKYVREIFADAVEEAKYKQALKAARQRSKERKQLQLKELQEKEEYLGSVVYNRTGQHLRALRKRTGSYLQELKGEERVDESIIRFLRFKVQRAHTMMS